MKQLDVAEATAQLSELIEPAAMGEVIVMARAGTPRAKIVGLGHNHLNRKPGKGKGRFRIKKGFDDPLPDEIFETFQQRSYR